MRATRSQDGRAAEFWSNGSQYSSKIYSGSADKKGLLEIARLANASCCAERASMTTLGTFTFHQFRSWVTPTGDARVEDWVGFCRAEEFDGRRVRLGRVHAPRDPLLRRIWTPTCGVSSREVPFLARHYANRGQAMFVAYVNNPFNGHVFAVHGARLKDDLRETYFSRNVDDDLHACPGAAKVAFSRERLEDWWLGLNGTAKNAETGLPDVLAVAYASLRFVEVGGARRRPARRRHAAADGAKSFMGANEGWARFLDYHIGLNVPGVLDDYRAPLDAVDAHYHAPCPQSGTPDDGSIFAEGASGLCVELHGVFNYTAFDPAPGA
ncbi:hypothetical protein JL720_14083 [Aureococcus anophagefferens]|nr:hypothetical protein JL720_14083 [Aureococcus anophagefferens]